MIFLLWFTAGRDAFHPLWDRFGFAYGATINICPKYTSKSCLRESGGLAQRISDTPPASEPLI